MNNETSRFLPRWLLSDPDAWDEYDIARMKHSPGTTTTWTHHLRCR